MDLHATVVCAPKVTQGHSHICTVQEVFFVHTRNLWMAEWPGGRYKNFF